MLTFAAAVFFLIITPGPGVLSTAGVGAGFGYRQGLGYVSGLCLGNFCVGLAVVTGVSAIVFSVPAVRTVLAACSAAYLLYLTMRIALAGSRLSFITRQSPPGFIGGVLLQFINPKAYAVNTALFSGFVFLPQSLWLETVIKFAILNAIWIPIHLGWLAAGVMLHRLDLSPRAHRLINMAMASSMLVVVILAIWSIFGN